jgi:hypothetical protein
MSSFQKISREGKQTKMQQYELEGDDYNLQLMIDLRRIYQEGRDALPQGYHKPRLYKPIHVFLKAFLKNGRPELTVASEDETVGDVMTVDHEGRHDKMLNEWWNGKESDRPTVFAHTSETVWKEMIAIIQRKPDMSSKEMQSALMSCLGEAETNNQTDTASG